LWDGPGFKRAFSVNLRIKHFFGTTDNAVKTQVWIAICVYVLVTILRKELKLELSLSQILQILSVNVFEQVPSPSMHLHLEAQLRLALQNGVRREELTEIAYQLSAFYGLPPALSAIHLIESTADEVEIASDMQSENSSPSRPEGGRP
jgi:alkylhydroperoxidase/carboxymuconolactone decarboxylase family protein YurZ